MLAARPPRRRGSRRARARAARPSSAGHRPRRRPAPRRARGRRARAGSSRRARRRRPRRRPRPRPCRSCRGSPRSAPSELLREKPITSGPAERGQLAEPADELEVLLDRLAEADARDRGRSSSSRTPSATANASRSSRKRLHLRDDVVVASGRPASCAARRACASGRGSSRRSATTPASSRVAAKRGDVVDELDAELERAPRDRGLRGVDRDAARRRVGRARARPGELLVGGDAVRAGPGRLAADVDDRRARVEHPPRRGDRRLRRAG